MAMVEEKEVDNTHYLPKNFSDAGRLFDGMIELRNLIEACVFAGGAFLLLDKVIYFENEKQRILTMIPIVLVIAAVCLIGVMGDPITIFFKRVFLFVKDRRRTRFKRIYTNPQDEMKAKKKKKRKL